MALLKRIINRRNNLILLLLPFFVACSDNSIYDESFKVSDELWNIDETIICEVPISDTLSSHNIYIHLRHADGYPYSNLYLFINTQMPGGGQSIDTLECILADANGRWLGKGLGDIYDCLIPFKKNVRFPHSGNYTFSIQQAMRRDELPLIMDVGMRIENNSKN